MYFSDNIGKEPCSKEHKYIMWLWTDKFMANYTHHSHETFLADQHGVNGRFSLPPNLIEIFRGEGGEEKRDAG